MTKKETDKMYIDLFIQSMENDFEQWKMTSYAGLEGLWVEYRSPHYETGAFSQRFGTPQVENSRFSFGFSSSVGAWINGHFAWRKPFLIPLSKTHLRFVKAERKMKRYLQEQEKLKHLEKLNRAIGNEIKP